MSVASQSKTDCDQFFVNSFWMTVSLGGRRIRGAVGASKKEAKLKAAEAALAALHASNEVPSISTNVPGSYDIVSNRKYVIS